MALNAPSNPPRAAFVRFMATLVAPTHGRRNVSANSPLRSPSTAMPVVLTGTLRCRFSFFYHAGGGHRNVSWVGRGGHAGP